MEKQRRGGRLVSRRLLKWIPVVKFNLYTCAIAIEGIGDIVQQRPKSEAFHL
jgi:hypothetical protein